jgi:predicted ATP-grasp superfamily ATP-dependent carboligase
MPHSLPALLLGGTNLVRALGLAGIPAIVASADPDEPALASRYCSMRHALPPPSQPEAAIDALLELSEKLFARYGRPVPLFYGNDDWLELVHAHRDRLDGHYLMILNDTPVAQSLMEKAKFSALAAERGLPMPATLKWEGDGKDSLRGFAGQVLVKPRVKVDWHDSPLHDRLFGDEGKALIFENGAAAMANTLVERYRNQLVFQEFIPGDDRNLVSYHGFADENGRVLQAFVGRKLRTRPPITGESAYIELIRDPGLSAFGRQIAERIPLRGPFKIDFKQDPRDGRLLVLEVNARCTLWNYLGAVNGVNLLKTAYEYQVEGRLPESHEYGTKYRWIDARREILGTWATTLFDGPRVHNVFSWDDPGPYAALWTGRVTRRGRRAAGKVLGRLGLWRSTAS